ncbi:MAG: hypothetical protein NTZ48_04050 [Candidatus Omnitrophica bacterium]|nr:hypothetical protein [Candidatus Omnitrophota bacterium]
MKKIKIEMFVLEILIGYSTYVYSLKNNDFFGMQVTDISDADNLIISGFRDGEVVYEFDVKRMSDSIFAWGRIAEDNYIEVDITNNSNLEIQTDYYQDIFTLVTQDGVEHYLGKGDISKYYSKGYIKTGETIRLYFHLPSTIRDIKKESVKMIICELGVSNKTTIVLKSCP